MIILFATILLLAIIRILPASEKNIRQSVCLVKGRVHLCLVNGQDTLEIQSDSVNQHGVWVNKYWWWPSCNGRVLTVEKGGAPAHTGNWLDDKLVASEISELTDSISRLLKRKNVERQELKYYLRTHSVQDEGYTRIAHYADLQSKSTDSLDRFYQRLSSFKLNQETVLLRKYDLRVTWFDSKGQEQSADCKPKTVLQSNSGGPVIIQTNALFKSWGVYAVRNMPWGSHEGKQVVTATIAPGDSTMPYRTILTTGRIDNRMKHDVPNLFAVDGSPVFTKHGCFVGIISKQDVRMVSANNCQ